jgi:hypothetical protein
MPFGVSYDMSYNVYVAGVNQGAATFGTNNITAVGGMDLLVAKLGTAPVGTIVGVSANKGVDATVKVYPNPAKESIHVDITQGESQLFSLEIFNMLGQSVFKETGITNGSASVPLNGLSNGVYSYQVSDGKASIHCGRLFIE